MANGVLYYPYIRVPETPWLTRMLLYWDSVSIIVPSDFFEEPERLGPHTQSLVQEGLLKQIIPAQHIPSLPDFEETFIEYLDCLGAELAKRRGNMQAGCVEPIHLEKLGTISRALIEYGLAERADRWYLVEENTALDFMTYLATILGQLSNINAIPVTDCAAGLSMLATQQPDTDIDTELSALRLAVLKDAFPAPADPLTATDILLFKDACQDLLSAFRLAVESELIRVADIQDSRLKARALNNLQIRISHDAEAIRHQIAGSGLGTVTSSKWIAVLGSLLESAQQVSIINSVATLFRRHRHQVIGPFAYAGYVQHELTK